MGWTALAPDLFCFPEACNVYAIRRGDAAVLVDAGCGAAASRLGEIGVRRVAHVLHTHHHRDQCGGSAALAAAGARLWAPEYEAELMGDPEGMWQGRALDNSYSGRTDRFSPLCGLPLAGVLADGTEWAWPGTDVRLRVLPTPGHTLGSCSLLLPGAEGPVAFTGDLLYGPGRVWSVAAFQYDYNGVWGALVSVRSLRELAAEHPLLLLPSHGRPMDAGAIAETEAALLALQADRDAAHGTDHAGLADALERPLRPVGPRLLRDTCSHATNWVVLSGDGHAVWIDYGYAHMMYTGWQSGGDRAGKRAVLHGLRQLREEFGVRQVDAVLVTHHHDDHVAGIAALRRATGCEVWVPEHFAGVLEHPAAYKTQCLWYDGLPVDRRLPLGRPVPWRGGTSFTAHAQPGHTRHAACLEFVLDGRRCLAIGDQFPQNHIYANGFALGDASATVALWRRLAPDLILPGHGPEQDGPAAAARFAADAARVEARHRQLLPLDEFDFGASGEAASVHPYRATLPPGGTLEVRVTARNPFARPASVEVRLVPMPGAGWTVAPEVAAARAEPGGSAVLSFRLTAGAGPVRRGRYAVELTVDGRPFGAVEEGFVTVLS
jgi:glyoxylase-like metal-dependent hydrolase (beta-lactamase superfamily II)